MRKNSDVVAETVPESEPEPGDGTSHADVAADRERAEPSSGSFPAETVGADELCDEDELDRLPQLEAMKGRDFYAVGGNQKAAVAIGINPVRTKIIAFAMAGFMAVADRLSGFASEDVANTAEEAEHR